MGTVMESTESEALFMSTREALTFALNYADQQCARSVMAALYSVRGSGRGLVGVYGAGEAGMIFADVHRLPQLEQDALCARFTKVRNECHCCGHEIDTPQVRESVGNLILYALQQSPTSNQNMVRVIVRDFFGLQPMGSGRVVAEQQGVHRNTVINHVGAIKKALRTLERQAERRIEKLLTDSGKVRG